MTGRMKCVARVGGDNARVWPPVGCLIRVAAGTLLQLTAAIAAFAAIAATAHAAEVRCATEGHYSFPQDDAWYKRRWPSGVRPTKDSCDTGFIYGPVREGDYEKVLALYRRNHPFMHSFALASPGGDVF